MRFEKRLEHLEQLQASVLANLVNMLPDFTDDDADLTEMQRH